ncbi:MAG: DivIVA domain-containing protein [Gemmatimonadetes bacterium]|nr:DivIVA domain-containing protein [Gemmatimonadota bacterium]
MIDITPLDVRKKHGDFKKAMRGLDVQEVGAFLDLVAERMEELVKEVLTLRERTTQLQLQVEAQGGREKAVQDALVTAQTLRDEIKEQARREAELVRREAEGEARRIVAEAERQLAERRTALDELERKRERFLMALRRLLERELDVVSVEEGRTPLDGTAVDLELPGGHARAERPAATGDGEAAAGRPGGPVKGELWLGLSDEPVPAAAPDPELGG